MNITNLILDALARGIRIGCLDPDPARDFLPVASDRWRLTLGDRRWVVSVGHCPKGRVEARIRACDDPDRDYEDEGGGIILDLSDHPRALVACQYFGELAGRLRSGYGGMDAYYPPHGIGDAFPWYPSQVDNRMRIGGDR